MQGAELEDRVRGRYWGSILEGLPVSSSAGPGEAQRDGKPRSWVILFAFSMSLGTRWWID